MVRAVGCMYQSIKCMYQGVEADRLYVCVLRHCTVSDADLNSAAACLLQVWAFVVHVGSCATDSAYIQQAILCCGSVWQVWQIANVSK